MTAGAVHSLDQARAIMTAANPDRPVRILSAPGAAGQHGIGWWQAMTRILREEFPHHTMEAALDCGDSPGLALAALRAGVPLVRVNGLGDDMREKLEQIAGQVGGKLIV